MARPFRKNAADSHLPLVEVTGGEPLLQKESLPLMKSLCDAGFTVLLETSGALDISASRSARAPHHGLEMSQQRRSRAQSLGKCARISENTDEIKFVIGTAQDYDWAKEIIKRPT